MSCCPVNRIPFSMSSNLASFLGITFGVMNSLFEATRLAVTLMLTMRQSGRGSVIASGKNPPLSMDDRTHL